MEEGTSVVGINWLGIHKCDGVSFQDPLMSSALVLR